MTPVTFRHVYLQGLGHLRRQSHAPRVAELVEGMATLLGSGVPVAVAMRCLAASKSPRGVRILWVDPAVQRLQQGVPLSTVWQDCASDLLYALLVAGEQSGSVPAALKLWLKYDAQQRHLRHELLKSSTYPLIILAGIVGVFILLVRVVVPSLQNMYSQLGVPLSPESRLLFSAVSLLPRVIVSLLAITLATAVVVIWLANRRTGWWTRVRKVLPGYTLLVMFRTERFCSVYQLLLSAGVSLIDATVLLNSGSYPVWLKNASIKLQERVLNGQALSAVFSGDWDGVLGTMVQWAEETGDLSGALERSADYVSLRLQRRLEWIVQLYGPLLLLGLGVAVAATMSAVFVPLYSMMNAMGTGQAAH